MVKLAPEGTKLRYVQDLVARAYAAMGAAGSNDDEHDVLFELVEYAEDDIWRMGGELPPHQNDEDY
jgi:hypothetical protein